VFERACDGAASMQRLTNRSSDPSGVSSSALSCANLIRRICTFEEVESAEASVSSVVVENPLSVLVVLLANRRVLDGLRRLPRCPHCLVEISQQLRHLAIGAIREVAGHGIDQRHGNGNGLAHASLGLIAVTVEL